MKSPKTDSKPSGKVKLEQKHVEKLYKALDDAGFGGMRIASMHLTVTEADAAPAAEDRGCHAELQPDGSYKIVC